MIEAIFFWIAVLLLFHSYVLFPLLISVLTAKKPKGTVITKQSKSIPFVSVLISVYNEEKVIETRINNVFQTEYPLDKLEVLVGSDGSNDDTNKSMQKLQEKYPALRLFLYDTRNGKGNVLNRIDQEVHGEIMVFTDAKVEFNEHTIFELVKPFDDQDIGIVGGNIINRNTSKNGISIQEKQFMSREMVIKYNEGRIWGTMVGAYGACMAMRKENFVQIPENFAVEDFFLSLKILEKGQKSILNLNAVCFEDVPNKLNEEFRRKVRISSGNFQNLKTFYHLLFKFNPLSFCFFSHKVIRWLGPFLLLIALICNILLMRAGIFYQLTLAAQLLLLIIPVIDFFLQKIHLHIITLRFVTHFYSMNLALLIGFIKYLKGIKTNVWEPTVRKHL